MKKILVVIAALFLCSNLFSQGIKFEHVTFAEALVKAKKENKLVFMDCYTSWCGPCKMLARNIFTQKEVGGFYNKNFVNLKVDMEKGEGPELAKKYNIKAYPTLLFINGDGEVVHTKLGAGGSANDFVELGKTACDPMKNDVATSNKYKSGVRSPEFIEPYMADLRRQKNDKYKEIFDWYFYATPKSEFLSKEGFKMLMDYAEYNTPAFDFIFKNKVEFEKILSESLADLLFENKASDLLRKATRKKSLTPYNNAVDYLKLNLGNDYSKFEDYIRWNILKRDEKTTIEGCSLAIEYLYKYDIKNPREYSKLAIHISSPRTELSAELYEKAFDLLSKSLELGGEDSGAIYGIKAQLYYKLGKTRKAIKNVKIAIEMVHPNFREMYEKRLTEYSK